MRFVNRSSAGGCLALAALLIAIVPGSVKGQGIQQRGTPAEVRASRSPSSVLKPAQGSNAALPRRKAAAITRKSSQAAITPAVPVTELDSIARQLDGSQSVPWSIVIGLTLLTLLPALLLSMTPLVRLLVVFHFLRQALGTQTAPSNQVLMGLGLMMTWFLMQPVLLQVDQTALAPYRAGTISGEQALQLGAAPVKAYMLRYAREKDLTLFASAGIAARPKMAPLSRRR